MSNPSFSNIDLWLFELNEGNLTPTQVEQLQTFLLQHPELDVDKDLWENAQIKPQEYVYTKKQLLIRENPIFRIMDFASVAVVLFAIITIGFVTDNDETSIASNTTDLSVNGDYSITEEGKINIRTNSKRSSTASSPNLTSSFSTSMNSLLKKSATVTNTESNNNSLFKESNQSMVSSRAPNQIGNVNSLNRTDVLNVSTEANDNHNRSSLNEFTSVANVSNSQGLIQSVANIDDYRNTVTSYTFYDVNNMNLRDLDSELGEKDYSLMASNKDHELNFFQKKKKTLTKYQLMLKNRVGSFSRKVMNMMNNPIALNNFRDPHYNIPGLSVSDINFSSAGTQLATRVQTLSRMQWYGKENQQLMNQLNLDGYVYAVRGGLALQLNHAMYKNGGVNVADVAITYSPKFSISNTVSLEPSFRFKMGNKNLNHSKMNGVNQLEIERGVVEDYYADGSTPIGRNLWYKDFGAGVTVNTKWFFVSAQVDNLFRHKDNMFSNTSVDPQRSDYQIMASIGTDWVSRSKNLSLSPYVVYQNEGPLSELWVGANARLKWFVIGASYSSTRNPSATVGVKFKHFSMYYNADYSKSVMTGERSLSHQVTLKFVGKQSRFGKGR